MQRSVNPINAEGLRRMLPFLAAALLGGAFVCLLLPAGVTTLNDDFANIKAALARVIPDHAAQKRSFIAKNAKREAKH